MSDTFPRQYARTQRLTSGEPRTFTVSPDGRRVVFLRSASGSDPVNSLWVLDTSSGTESEVLNPRSIPADLTTMTPEEARRRERAREGSGGVVTYACDSDVRNVVTVLGGQIIHVDVMTGAITVPVIAPGVFDARLSPDGSMMSFVRGSSLCVAALDGPERVVAAEDSDVITWGSAEFIAAEEMGRMRGYWWSPDSRSIAACRVDVSPVPIWFIADPAHPERPPVEHRYPVAGAANALVTLHVIDVGTMARTDVRLDGDWEYLNSVAWSTGGLIAQTQTRDQTRIDIHRIDPKTGDSRIVFTDTDDAWVELVPGVPGVLDDGRIVTCVDRDGARRIAVDGLAVTPPTMQVRSVSALGDVVVFAANDMETPAIIDVRTLDLTTGSINRISEGEGVSSVSGRHDHFVLRTNAMDSVKTAFTFISSTSRRSIPNLAEAPLVEPNVRLVSVGARGIPTAILSPRDGANTKLPVLFSPYGGPHAQRVMASNANFVSSQWFADQGFIVVIADNIGTPGRGSKYERGVHGDLAQVVLDDQVEVLRALDDLEPRADTSRVGIRGWSYGGYLAALAVLRRGDVFHAAVAGAPVTDWRLYDTHYTERYLGNPSIDDSNYVATSLIEDAHKLERPLLLVHGLADDNVVAAHTLQLSSALLAAGKQHEVLPLSNVTHMTPQEIVAENLLLHELAFLKKSLG